MKRFLSIFFALALLTLTMGVSLAASNTTQADATSSATQSPSNGNSQNPAPGPRGNNGNFLMGSVTAISDASITITTNTMQPPQNGNGPKDDDRQGGDRDHVLRLGRDSRGSCQRGRRSASRVAGRGVAFGHIRVHAQIRQIFPRRRGQLRVRRQRKARLYAVRKRVAQFLFGNVAHSFLPFDWVFTSPERAQSTRRRTSVLQGG